jgi:23S rRNA (uridine2552-2'-O)-methyltransferase
MSDMAAAAGAQGRPITSDRGAVRGGAAFAFDVLEDGGTFVAKVLAGGAEGRDADEHAEEELQKVART